MGSLAGPDGKAGLVGLTTRKEGPLFWAAEDRADRKIALDGAVLESQIEGQGSEDFRVGCVRRSRGTRSR